MTIDAIIRTINLILTPVVMSTSCTIFLNGLFTRYESVSQRMRAMHRERLELLQGLEDTTSKVVPLVGFSTHRIHQIEVQLPQLLQRHKLIHDAVLAVNGAITLFVLSMFILALAELTNSSFASIIALLTFLVGMSMLLVGVITTTLELFQSRREVAYEIQDGLRLRKEDLQ